MLIGEHVKKLTFGFISIVALLFVLVFVGKNYLPTWISTTLSQKMGVNVFVQKISLSPKAIEVHRLLIDNPPGFILDTALKAKKIVSDSSIFALLHHDVVINQVDILDFYLGLEFVSVSNTNGNWTIIIQNLQNSLDSVSSENPKKFLIKTLAIHNMNIDLVFQKKDGKIRHLKPIPYMEFKNISSEGPFPMEQLTKIVMSEVLKKIFLENQLKNMLDMLQNPSQKVYTPFKGLFSFEPEEARPPLRLLSY